MKMTATDEITMPEPISADAEESMPLVSKKYEIMVIISSSITDEEIQQRLKDIKGLLGSDIVYEEMWGMRPFAFPIKKQTKGYYAVWNFMSNVEAVKELEDTFKLYPDLLRYLILKVPEDYQPITLPKIEAGLEKLTQEKAEKRGQTKTSVQRRDEKAKEPTPAELTPKAEAKPAPSVAEGKEEEKTPATEEKAPPAEKAEEKAEKKPEKKPEKAKTLDEKLDDILSDADLGL